MRMMIMSGLKSPRNHVAEHVANLPRSGIRDFFELVNTMEDVISLGVGEPDFTTPWHIRESAVYSLERGRTSYTSNLGLLSLRKKICAYVYNNYGAEYDPKKECIVTVGVSEALDLIVRAITSPGDEIIYHEPCYVSYPSEIIMAHGKPVPVSTSDANGFMPDPDAIAKAVTKKTRAILLNFPCNPTGAVLDSKTAEAIAKIAVKHDLLVITDEIYSELAYERKSSSVASLPGMRDRTVFLHGFSKAFAMTGFRIGYACGPEHIIEAMMKIHQYTMLCASIIAQEAAEEALSNGRAAMEKMRTEYMERRNVICGRLNKMGLACVKPGGAFYAFPRISSTGLSSMEFSTRLLREHGVAAVPGTAFGASGEGFIRCCYAASMDNIVEAMDKMEMFVKSL
jgi:aminotransferase